MHFEVFVAIDADAADAEEAVATALADYEGQKWDWFRLGGRFTGALTGYDPEKDPANVETCVWCKGTGRRDDATGREARKANPEYTCNGCGGEGKRVKWPTQWAPHAGDVGSVKAALEADPPYALVIDGEWIESETFFYDHGASKGQFFKQTDWPRVVREMLSALDAAAKRIVVVDCHN